MVVLILDSGSEMRFMATVSMCGRLDRGTKALLSKGRSMDKALRFIRTALNIKENSIWVREMELENILEKTAKLT